jgi:outer membrane protein OmpA-like peptidoglycan-associated protein
MLPTEAELVLTKIAALVGNSDRRVQLNAYAGGTPETVGAARRLSLSRALTVRAFLIEAGVRSTRIDVRALGLASDDAPLERVDIMLLSL